MSETIDDVEVLGDDWININTESNTDIGTRMILTNIGKSPALLYEGITKPNKDYNGGKPLTTQNRPYAEIEAKTGSLAIWAKANRGTKSKTTINVQK
ncbi:hypothetical protein NVP3058O_025 [Vibrio phage 3.058.O._10N.286.46.B8]|nr:hypothetical protein NVP2058O_026 [Vibrio phage 2.058.O._10N.286.46.B8]AUS03095.1 hypothetical protein NVP3058O_025 [Vibrio phage 3.058.O._10N.286.46.B8]